LEKRKIENSMKEIFIERIGYDWWTDSGTTAKGVQKQLEGLEDGEDIKLIINSPGGSVYEGIVIFNLIRDYAKTHPVSVRINCIAMSMGSYIALAARTVNKDSKVTASENSVMMIHNPWTYTWGDYRDLKKEADYLEKLAALYGSVHAAISGKSEKEIRAAMDEETYYVGKEIEEIGFANEYEKISETENEGSGESAEFNALGGRDAIIAKAHHENERTKERAREAKTKDAAAYRSDLEKAVALYKPSVPKPPAAESAKTSGKNNLGGLMTPEELKAQNKALYDAVFAQGETAGVDNERARVNAHLLLGEKAGSLAVAAKHIKAGVSSADETAQAEYYAAKLDGAHLEARNRDNVGDIKTGDENGAAMDDAKLTASFNNGFQGRNSGGEPWTE
jgi:ATP-dependent protease ClpP protease subunit